MPQNRLIQLLFKKKSGSLSLPEQKELSALMTEYSQQQDMVDFIENLFDRPLSFDDDIDDEKVSNALKRLNKRLENNKPTHQITIPFYKRKSTFWIAAAASIILAIFTGLFFYYNKPKIAPSFNENIFFTKKGSRSNLILPDGSQVWLNADSKISYNEDFGKKQREITLTGEAYFDVVRDSSRPFIIHTPTLDVKVLGTTFNVRAYPDEKNTETTLFHGSVQVTLNKDQRQVIFLKPDQKLSVQNAYDATEKNVNTTVTTNLPIVSLTNVKKIETDSLSEEVQWTKSRLAFSNKRLDEAAMLISRWFGAEVIIKDENIKNKEYTGMFGNQSLQEVMESLKLAGGFRYNIKNDTVTIEP